MSQSVSQHLVLVPADRRDTASGMIDIAIAIIPGRPDAPDSRHLDILDDVPAHAPVVAPSAIVRRGGYAGCAC